MIRSRPTKSRSTDPLGRTSPISVGMGPSRKRRCWSLMSWPSEPGNITRRRRPTDVLIGRHCGLPALGSPESNSPYAGGSPLFAAEGRDRLSSHHGRFRDGRSSGLPTRDPCRYTCCCSERMRGRCGGIYWVSRVPLHGSYAPTSFWVCHHVARRRDRSSLRSPQQQTPGYRPPRLG